MPGTTPEREPVLVRVQLGPISLRAPHGEPRRFTAAHGHLWQWVGDGQPLLSLTAAVRGHGAGAGTARDVADRLALEVEQVLASYDEGSAQRTDRGLRPRVDGALAAGAVLVDGVADGHALRNGLLVSTDGSAMHVLRVAVADTAAGRALVTEVLDDVRVHPRGGPG